VNPVVIDTGVLVAGVFWRNEAHRCVRAWLRGLLTPVVSEAILVEYERVLREVKAEQGFATSLEPWLAALRKSTYWSRPSPWSSLCAATPRMTS
jgi:predicted nucleic acid-binding protein